MKKIRTQYDNLKVARNAPPEVIKAAYKSLSNIYHPDKHPGDPKYVGIMQIINHSYETLSDVNKRKIHDEWIKSQEGEEKVYEPKIMNTKPTDYPKTERTKVSYVRDRKRNIKESILNAIKNIAFPLIAFIGVVVVMAVLSFIVDYFDSNSDYNNQKIVYQKTPPVQYVAPVPEYYRPALDPNGKSWPSKSGYLIGTKNGNNNGLSKVTIDNSGNNSDVHCKLVYINQNTAHPVREFYILAYSKFTLNKVTKGNYDIRYRDLRTGSTFRSEAFELFETRENDGIKYHDIIMTLYMVQNGNMKTYNIPESEF